jgi:hypothetical protein
MTVEDGRGGKTLVDSEIRMPLEIGRFCTYSCYCFS